VLEEKGIIKGYHADIDPVAAPQNLTFVAVIKTTPQSYDKITEILKNEPCVKTLCKMSGESQLHAICVANDFAQMQKFADRLNNCDIGLISFSAKMVWEIVKGSVLPN
jgi:DNA-binding Lrp family transcriptional regulator